MFYYLAFFVLVVDN